MSALLPLDARRPVPTVAIIGNDAVLMAAPATPVQVAHACLRRGFSVAVPASWGDELLAAEAMRRLAASEHGPAVMCVCPFVRSRLLAPGPDLAPFLVSLVPPPVATARYLRTVYGDHGVHITYIGGCPGADDSSIDARLTPDAFLADLAENGIALTEQPLVFDSIVPPDRRRWCSLPGGSPSAEVLWSEADARPLIEIERDDASTQLAQHIIGREHVLLDLAPALGCMCSGAISSIPARSARVAVTALEPPRSLGPVVDPAVVVSLDAPVADRSARATAEMSDSTAVRPDAELMEQRLDELLGTQVIPDDSPVADELIPNVIAANAPAVDAQRDVESSDVEPDLAPIAPDSPEESPTVSDQAVASDHPVEPERQPAAPVDSPSPVTAPTPATDGAARKQPTVRRPTPTHTRHPSASIPKATASDGRALPRAYVAKRRTPPGGIATVGSVDSDAQSVTLPDTAHDVTISPAAPELNEAIPTESAIEADLQHASVGESAPGSPSEAETPPAPVALPHDNPVATTSASEPVAMVVTEPAGPVTAGAAGSLPGASSSVPHVTPSSSGSLEAAPQTESNRQRGAAAASAPNPSMFVLLLLALIALAIFVLRSLG